MSRRSAVAAGQSAPGAPAAARRSTRCMAGASEPQPSKEERDPCLSGLAAVVDGPLESGQLSA
jgi:hypothetical protein